MRGDSSWFKWDNKRTILRIFRHWIEQDLHAHKFSIQYIKYCGKLCSAHCAQHDGVKKKPAMQQQ